MSSPGALARTATAAVLLGALMAAGCGDGGRRYEATGRVEEVIAEEGVVVIAHDDIPGLMDAMTMSFDATPGMLGAVSEGDRVDFALSVSQGGMKLIELRRSSDVPGEGAALERASQRFAAARERGESAPPFALTDQRGEPLALEDLAGHNLLIDFIFTECQGPCPILTAKHAAVQRALEPAVAERSWFVSISLDPANDTPEALTRYAERRGADLERWSFLTGSSDAVADVVRRYGIGTTRDPDGTLQHLVATFLVDGEGRIVKRYVGLEHASGEIAADLADLALLDAELAVSH